MTESIEVETTGDGLFIDKSKQFKANAGQCPQCGHYKTWEFRIANPKTGKQMPGHVTKEGFKIGDGNCPYWENISKINAKKTDRKIAAQPRPAGSWIGDITGPAQPVRATVQSAQQESLTANPSVAKGQIRTVAVQAPVGQGPSPELIVARAGATILELSPKDAIALAISLLTQLLARER
ncbi:MAG TPA: hypothetical protein VKM55_26300 [Candidatus Lokiarchaeia archaeon]|nr:hypothetical protein [Candidatus Lokiarchaeia archaeon]